MHRPSRTPSVLLVIVAFATVLGCAGGGGGGTDCESLRHDAYVRCCEERFFGTYIPGPTQGQSTCSSPSDPATQAFQVCINDTVPSECER